MSIRTKVIIVILVVSLLYAVAIYAVAALIIYPGFITLERSEAIENANRIAQALNGEVDHMKTFTHDWAAWDDTYEFVKDNNNEYVDANLLDETFIDANLDLIYITDETGKVIFGRVFDEDDMNPLSCITKPELVLPKDSPLFLSDDPLYGVQGIYAADPYPLVISSEPIVTSENQGPVEGFFIMGRFLDDEYVNDLKLQTRIDFEYTNLLLKDIPKKTEDTLTIRAGGIAYDIKQETKDKLSIGFLMKGVGKTSSMYVNASLPRDITRSGKNVIKFTVASVIAAGLILILVFSLHIGGVVILPLSVFTNRIVEIRKSGNLNAITRLTRKDEIGTLSREFDYLLAELLSARTQLSEQAYRAGLADMMGGILHNLRNVATPLVKNTHEIGQALEGVPQANITRAIHELADANISEDRRRDLVQYLVLASDKLDSGYSDIKTYTESLAAHTEDIIELLMQFESYAYTERELELVNIKDLVNDAFNLVPEKLRSKATLNFKTVKDSPESVELDRLVLLHILLNIINNSAEAIERSGIDQGRIDVTSSVENDNDERYLCIQIDDNGIGIEQANIARLFNREYTTKAEGKGGFGLPWCANAIGSQNGRITASSDGVGKGASFKIMLRMDK